MPPQLLVDAIKHATSLQLLTLTDNALQLRDARELAAACTNQLLAVSRLPHRKSTRIHQPAEARQKAHSVHASCGRWTYDAISSLGTAHYRGPAGRLSSKSESHPTRGLGPRPSCCAQLDAMCSKQGLTSISDTLRRRCIHFVSTGSLPTW